MCACVHMGVGVRKCVLFYSMFIRLPCFLPYTSLIIFTKLLFFYLSKLREGRSLINDKIRLLLDEGECRKEKEEQLKGES